MTKAQSQPILETPSPEELQAWADEAQACVDSGKVVISDHRKAEATIMALRSHAALKARIKELEGALQPIVEIIALEWRFKGAHPHREALIQGAVAALQPKAGS